MRQVLAGGCLSLRRLAGGGEVIELVLGGGCLVAGFVGYWALGEGLHRLAVLDGVHG